MLPLLRSSLSHPLPLSLKDSVEHVEELVELGLDVLIPLAYDSLVLPTVGVDLESHPDPPQPKH